VTGTTIKFWAHKWTRNVFHILSFLWQWMAPEHQRGRVISIQIHKALQFSYNHSQWMPAIENLTINIFIAMYHYNITHAQAFLSDHFHFTKDWF
jgi:hypothetical protein